MKDIPVLHLTGNLRLSKFIADEFVTVSLRRTAKPGVGDPGQARPRCACIEDPAVIRKTLDPLQEKSPLDSGIQIANPRAPPQASLFGYFDVIFLLLPDIAAQNGFDRGSAGLRTSNGGKTAKEGGN